MISHCLHLPVAKDGLVTGAPEIGKTSLVNLIARTLASHPAAIEGVNGREVGLDVARE